MPFDLSVTVSAVRAALAATDVRSRVERLEVLLGALCPGAALAVRCGRGRPAALRVGLRPKGAFRLLGRLWLPGCPCMILSAGEADVGVMTPTTRGAGALRALGEPVLRALRGLALHHAVACPAVGGNTPASGSDGGLVVLSPSGAPVVVDPEARAILGLAPLRGGLLADAVLQAAGHEGGGRAVVDVSGGLIVVTARRLETGEAVVDLSLRRRERAGALAALTSREAAVAGQVARGATNREVAVALGIAAATVKRHLERVYQKTGVHGRTELAALVLDGELPAWVPGRGGGAG